MVRALLFGIIFLSTLPFLALIAPPVSADRHTETANLRVDGMV